MVNVHIHRFAADGAPDDPETVRFFHAQWTIYQKLVDANVLRHREIAQLIHEALNARFMGAFTFLDIACGDASLAKRALEGTRVARYHGVDLAMPAIEFAAANLDGVPYEVDLDYRDYAADLAERALRADAVWCGLSMHHLDTAAKLRVMREIHALIAPGGLFMLYEPTLADGETRADYMRRIRPYVLSEWVMLSGDELAQILEHIETCDLPETSESWISLGLSAGFSQGREVYAVPAGFFRVYRFLP